MARAVRPPAPSRSSSTPSSRRPGRSRARRQRLLTHFDGLPTEAQTLLVSLAADLARATQRREAEAMRLRAATDRQLLVACLERATPPGSTTRGRA